MSRLTLAALRRDTPAVRAVSGLLINSARADGGHQLVWTLFASDPGARRSFLFRQIDAGVFLILSEAEPCDAEGLWNLRSRPFTPSFDTSSVLDFRLRANPARRARPTATHPGGRVDAIVLGRRGGAADLEWRVAALSWLFAREDRIGVRFDRDACAAADYVKRDIKRPGASITFAQIDFSGRLHVVDPPRLMAAVKTGIGKAKAFGCGLLLMRTD